VATDRRWLAARWRTEEGAALRDQLVARLRAGDAVPAEAVRALGSEYPGHRALDLRRVDLSGQNLDGIDLAGVDLQGANLARSSLVGANLVGADLREALLRKTDLSRANLTGANLDRAVLEDVRLDGATLDGVKVTEDTRLMRAEPLHISVRRMSRWLNDAADERPSVDGAPPTAGTTGGTDGDQHA
jgi:hypothetical protein